MALALLLSAQAFGQAPPPSLTPEQLENLHYQIKTRASTQFILQEHGEAVPRLLRFSNSRRIGYLNLKGEIVVPPSLEGAAEFHAGRIRARLNGKWGFLDHEGRFVIPPKYEELSIIWMTHMPAKLNGLWGLLDQKGDWTVEPVYDELRLANKSFEFKKDGKWGVIGPAGEILLPASYEEIRTSGNIDYITIRVGRKWGIADRKGKFIHEPQYDRVILFDPGVAVVDRDGTQGMIEISSGKTLLPFEERRISPTTDRQRWVVIRERMYGVVDRANRAIIKQEYGIITGKGDGYLEISKDKLKALASISGKFLTDFVYEQIDYFREGMVAMKVDGKWGYLDTNGRVAIAPRFSSAFGFSQGIASVALEGKRGYIDKQGAFVIAPRFDEAYEFFQDGIATVKLDGEYVYIDRQGKPIGRLLQPEIQTSETFFKP